MGLDSVELLFQFEKKFQIVISDEEAAKLFTLEDATNTIAQHKNVTKTTCSKIETIKTEIFDTLKQVATILNMSPNDKISSVLNAHNKGAWNAFEEATKYKIKKPYFDSKSKTSILSKLQFWKPNYDWNELTIEEFIDGILIFNYELIVDFINPNGIDEIYIGVAGLTADRTGIDVYDIKPFKSFTRDLGID
ncbi:hypothetical protein [Soonwooa sp.]|uniref:hypothetical protein n=1 Tax=Soonwooa sp. TaxID=1938592 RepID=UPI00260FAED6|nr:hypothetical protein [Soonwooa sp.]